MPSTASIAHVTSCYPPHLGGVEVVAQALAGEQARSGAQVVVLTTTAGAPEAPRRDREGRVKVRRYQAFTLAHTPIAPGLLIGLLRQPASTIRHVHVAHAFTTELVWLTSRVRGAPFVAHFHLDVAPSGTLGWLLSPYKKYCLGPALRAATTVIALSPGMAEFLVNTYRISPERVSVVRNGVGQEFVDAGDRRDSRSAMGRPLQLLFAGRIAPQKNLPRLLRALTLVSEPVHLTVVGDGEARVDAEELVSELDLTNVTFVGAKFGADYRSYLAAADVFVLPSDREGMPVAVLEAMAAGVPILATRVSGTAELVEGFGSLVEPTSEALAEGIRSLVGRDDLLVSASALGKVKASTHAWPAVASELALHYPLTRGDR